jgi:uncharacterized OsmC-like protein
LVTIRDIHDAIEEAVRYLSEHSEEARYTDSAATAVLEEGLRCRVTGPRNEELVTDMPGSVGGTGTAPSPGWLFRGALASCTATLIAMEAARRDIALQKLEVTVDSESDDRGILGMDDAVPPGPLAIRVHVRLAAENVNGQALVEVARWGDRLCPVGDAVRRSVPARLEVETER